MFKDLTKGGQTFFQSMRMFFDIFWKLVATFIFVFIIFFIGLFYLKTTPYQRYQALMLAEVSPMSFLFDSLQGQLDKLGLSTKGNPETQGKVDFKSSDGSTVKLTDDEIVQRIATAGFLSDMQAILIWGSVESLLIALLFTVLIAKMLMYFGRKVSEQKTVRGSTSCSPEELAKLVTKKGFGKTSEISIANIPLPIAAETKHCLINGSVGSGKTVCLSEIMAQVRKSGKKAIVYDKMGTHTARFYRPGKDIILNPFDERSPLWLLANEIRMDADYKSIASSLIPEEGKSAQDPFWNIAARELLAASAKYLHKEGKTDNVTLLDYVLGADLDRIKELLKDTVVGALVSEHSEKTTTSIKSILTAYISSLEYLPTEGEIFSIRDWVADENNDSWLFITSRADMHQAVKPLISTWLDIATNAVLSLPRSRERRIYEFLDELPTLQMLPSLPISMAEGRQFGLCVFITIQSLSQIYKHYGEHAANEVMDLCNTLVALRAPDRKTANMISDMLNEAEVEEFNESLSYGVTDNRDGVSINRNRHMQKVALPSEIQNLDDLEAYLRIPGNFPIAKIKFDYVDYEELNKPIILREGIAEEININKNKPVANHEDDDGVVDGLRGIEKDDKQPKIIAAHKLVERKTEKNIGAVDQSMLVEQENANVPIDKSIDDDRYNF